MSARHRLPLRPSDLRLRLLRFLLLRPLPTNLPTPLRSLSPRPLRRLFLILLLLLRGRFGRRGAVEDFFALCCAVAGGDAATEDAL